VGGWADLRGDWEGCFDENGFRRRSEVALTGNHAFHDAVLMVWLLIDVYICRLLHVSRPIYGLGLGKYHEKTITYREP
jgi:hypothetical protein